MDVIWLNKFLLGSVGLTEAQKLAADTTKDGAVSPEDSLLLLRWVVEIETPDPGIYSLRRQSGACRQL